MTDFFKTFFWVFFGSKVGPVSRNPNLQYAESSFFSAGFLHVKAHVAVQ